MTLSITSSNAGTANTADSNNIDKNNPQINSEKKGSIFGRVLTWFSDLFSHKASNETKECFLVAIFKSIAAYINPWHNTTVEKAPEEGNRANSRHVETALGLQQTNKSNSSQQEGSNSVLPANSATTPLASTPIQAQTQNQQSTLTIGLESFLSKDDEGSSQPALVMNDAATTLTTTAQQPRPSMSNQQDSPLPAPVMNNAQTILATSTAQPAAVSTNDQQDSPLPTQVTSSVKKAVDNNSKTLTPKKAQKNLIKLQQQALAATLDKKIASSRR